MANVGDSDATAPPNAVTHARFRSELRRTGANASWIRAEGELDLATSPELAQTLRRALPGSRLLVLDLHGLTLIDPSGIPVILDAASAASPEARTTVILSGPLHVEQLLTITKPLDRVFVLDPGRDAGIRDVLRLTPQSEK
jgi:anti-anti-sigma factor